MYWSQTRNTRTIVPESPLFIVMAREEKEAEGLLSNGHRPQMRLSPKKSLKLLISARSFSIWWLLAYTQNGGSFSPEYPGVTSPGVANKTTVIKSCKIDQTESEGCLLFKFSLAYYNWLFGHFSVHTKIKNTCRILKIQKVFLVKQ